MSPRRIILALGLAMLAAAGTGAAMLPWPVGTPTAAAFVSRGLHEFGLALTAEGPSAMTFLPMPRLSFTRTRIASSVPGGPALIDGGGLVLELNPLALLSGKADIGSISLDGATIALPHGADDPHWAEPIRRVAKRLGQGGAAHPRRIILSRATLTAPEAGAGAEDVDLTLAWPFWSSSLDAAASLTWRGARTRLVAVGLRPADLLSGTPSPFSVSAGWPAGSLSAEGVAATAEGLALTGRGRIETRSLPETLAWIGGTVALAPFIQALALDGRFETRGWVASLPSIRVSLGDDVLDGAGSVTFGETRASVQATLAAERLNLAPLLGGLVQVFGDGEGAAGATGPSRPVALAPLTGGDLDLRLSASEGRIGPVQLHDLATSVLVRRGSVEVALNRAGLQGGILKGRVALSALGADGGETEIKAQGAFERLDLGGLFAALGESRWVQGGTQGQFAVETSGREAADLAARLAGRASLTIEGGLIAGLDLADVLHRNGAVATGALARRNGRTPFERATIALKFADGIGEIGEGSLKAATLLGTLRGHVSVPERRLRARAEIGPRVENARAPATFEIDGPWHAVTVRGSQGPKPDSRVDTPPSQPLQPPAATALPGSARAYVP